MPSFFRPEALAHQRQGWLGSIQLIRPVSFTVLTVFVIVVAVLSALYLTLGQYTRKARVSGYLVPDRGVIRLVAPQNAIVLERHVREGQAVKTGDALFVLSTERTSPAGDTQAAVRSSLAVREKSLQDASRQHSQLDHTRTAALQRQIADTQRELKEMSAEMGIQRERLTLARQAQARLESLRGENFISSAQVQAKAEEVLGVRAQLQSLARQQIAKQREIAALQAQLQELPLQTQALQGEIERHIAELAQSSAENEALARTVIRAPQDGVVTAVLAERGQPVTPSSALASLVPSDALMQAHLFAPSSAVGFVRADQAVLLRYQAYPHQKFGHQAGHVLEVSRTPLQPAELASLALPSRGDASEPLYRITVALDQQSVQAYGQPQPLASGMQLDADVLLDRRRLIEWLFEPVLSVAGRV